MYSKDEKPIITCSIYYYDTDYKKSTGEQVLNILEKHNMFPPEKFYAGKLTKNQFVYASEATKEIMAKKYVNLYSAYIKKCNSCQQKEKCND